MSKICIQSIKKISKKHKKFLSFLTEQKYSQKVSDNPVNHSSCPEPLPSGVKKVPARQTWEKSKSVSLEQCKPVSAALQGKDFEYTAKIRTLAETERFFDELTKEKDQVKLIRYKKNLFLNLMLISRGNSQKGITELDMVAYACVSALGRMRREDPKLQLGLDDETLSPKQTTNQTHNHKALTEKVRYRKGVLVTVPLL